MQYAARGQPMDEGRFGGPEGNEILTSATAVVITGLLLAERVVYAIDWLAAEAALSALPVGCFGASTGAAAALIAAAERPQRVAAVVSRGGRPDLAGDALPRVKAPTLLIVGGRDTEVIRLNQEAQALLGGESRLEIVPGATHLFEEPGALERVAVLAREWFLRYLAGGRWAGKPVASQ